MEVVMHNVDLSELKYVSKVDRLIMFSPTGFQTEVRCNPLPR